MRRGFPANTVLNLTLPKERSECGVMTQSNGVCCEPVFGSLLFGFDFGFGFDVGFGFDFGFGFVFDFVFDFGFGFDFAFGFDFGFGFDFDFELIDFAI
ncbi:hypothetical protein [Fructilactobacillus sanfranciscensis]|uniref:hypothetical protein n=1 Tax=Fructilactobacillus sanfranciscensis TaxID=1625 RepID=UPI0031F7B07A